jgi:hypothetical protein
MSFLREIVIPGLALFFNHLGETGTAIGPAVGRGSVDNSPVMYIHRGFVSIAPVKATDR